MKNKNYLHIDKIEKVDINYPRSVTENRGEHCKSTQGIRPHHNRANILAELIAHDIVGF